MQSKESFVRWLVQRVSGTRRWPYLVVALVLALISAVAFHQPGYIAYGDLWPHLFVPGNTVLENSTVLWGRLITGMGSPQFFPTNVVLALWARWQLALGLGGPTVQLLFQTLLLIWAGLGTAFFVRTLFPDRPFAAVVAGIALPVSLYTVVIITNVVLMTSTGLFPWLAGYLVRRLRTPVPAFRFGTELGLISLAWMILVATPPVAVYALLWAGAWVLAGWYRWKTAARTWRGLLLGLVLAVALNGWWAYGAYVTLFGSGGSVEWAFAAASDWSWVQQRATLLNLLSMQSSWAWPRPEYFPWAGAYARGILFVALYLPAVGALAGAIFGLASAEHRPRTRALLVILLGSMFLAKGMNPPIGGVNAFLYNHVPGFWLLRDPQVEANITLYLSLYTLAGYGCAEVLLRVGGYVRNVKVPSRRAVRGLCAGALVLVQSLSGYALATGIFLKYPLLGGDAKPVVQLPQYWFDAAGFLNRQNQSGRVLVLPNDDAYQMPYDWGFYGADAVPQTLVKMPVLPLSPDSTYYVGAPPPFKRLQQDLVDAIRSGEARDIRPVLQALNVSWILVRHDIRTDVPNRKTIPPEVVSTFLQQQPGVAAPVTFGKLDVYQVKGEAFAVRAFSGAGRWLGNSLPDLNKTSALAGGEVPWLLGEQAGPIVAHGTQIPASLSLPTAQGWSEAGKALLESKTVRLSARYAGVGKLEVSLDGLPLLLNGQADGWKRSTTLPLPDSEPERLSLDVAGRSFTMRTTDLQAGERLPLGTLTIPADANAVPVILWASDGQNVLGRQDWGAVGDCNAYDKRTKAEVGIAAQAEGAKGIRLQAIDHAACANITANVSVASGDVVLAEVEYRHLAGEAPAVSVSHRKVLHATMPDRADWQRWDRLVPVEPTTQLALFVYAQGANKEPATENAYRNPGIWLMHRVAQVEIAAGVQLVEVPASGVQFPDEAGTEANLLKDPAFSHGLWNPTFNANAYKAMTNEEAGLKATVLPGGTLQMQARLQAIGEGQTIAGVAGLRLQLSLEARTVRGSAPLAKLLDDHGHVLWQSQFDSKGAGWQRADVTIDVPPDSDQVHLYLYAFGDGSPTSVEFRNLSLQAWPAGRGSLLWVGGHAPESLRTTAVANQAEYTATVPKGARLLVLSETFSKGWVLESGGRPLPFAHVAVDGFLNGWILPEDAPTTVQLRYAPERYFRILQWAGLVALAMSLGGWVFLVRRGRERPAADQVQE